ncbi:MAG: 2-amino-4-hydroxy-6-hydroxymethyldihydropteridine diphosphokinase [Deltaproteobacteria bacterium]|nr:2-amino-4-hydroxy-6-hydroxymethyldihydropteridine diphosphokinase [Deltaproteobacteria bacterium]
MTDPAREPIVIGIGGNIGTHDEILERFIAARLALSALVDVRSASLYRTAPVGPSQPPFLNTALRLRLPDAEPRELIATLLEIERLLGRDRDREERWGPRPIDLDILVWGARVIRTPELEVPHPRLVERRFALAPLADLLPDGEVPGHGPIAALLERVRDQPIEHLSSTW